MSNADDYYPMYESVNTSFAKRLAEVYQPGDLIWVHDYHLLLVCKMIREMLPDAALGLFLHTPFPSSEVFRCLPSTSPHVLLLLTGTNKELFNRKERDPRWYARCRLDLFPGKPTLSHRVVTFPCSYTSIRRTRTRVTLPPPACEYVATNLALVESTWKGVLQPLRTALSVSTLPELDVMCTFLYQPIFL